MTTLHLALRCAHITGGLLGLVTGFAAMAFPKGSWLHRRAGNAFFVSILFLSVSGGIITIFIRPNAGNLMGAMMAFYLVATAWATVIRPAGQRGRLMPHSCPPSVWSRAGRESRKTSNVFHAGTGGVYPGRGAYTECSISCILCM